MEIVEIENDTETDVDTKRKRKNKSYSIDFKRRAVEMAKSSAISETGRKLGVDRERVSQWSKQQRELQIQDHSTMRKRLDGGGRKPLSEELEHDLFEWIKECRAQKWVVTRKRIQLKAREMSEARGDLELVASNGWLMRFMARKGLTLRRVTTACQKDPDQLSTHIANFILFVRNLRIENKYPLELIYGADEVGVWLDGLTDSTIDFVGNREIAVKTTGNEKLRFKNFPLFI